MSMDIPLSRSERKRRSKQLEKLVMELGHQSIPLIDALPCDEEIRDLLRQASSLKGGARKRQIKYVTKLLRNDPENIDALFAFMAGRQGTALQDKREFHEIEYIRDSLLNEALEQRRRALENHGELEENWSSRIVQEVGRQFPGIDQVLLTRLSWLFARTRNRKHSREIFRILRAAHEEKRFAGAGHGKEKEK
jgi:ribosome-associated protein